MKIYNVIWVVDLGEPKVESYAKFKDALADVKSVIKAYKNRFELSAYSRQEEDWFYANMPDLLEVEIVKTKVL